MPPSSCHRHRSTESDRVKICLQGVHRTLLSEFRSPSLSQCDALRREIDFCIYSHVFRSVLVNLSSRYIIDTQHPEKERSKRKLPALRRIYSAVLAYFSMRSDLLSLFYFSNADCSPRHISNARDTITNRI